MGKEVFFDRITAKNVGFDLPQEAVNVSRALTKFPFLRKEIIKTTARQIRTYESETLKDSVVSYYPCFLHSVGGKTKLFSSDIPHEQFLMESQIDSIERDGAPLNGFRKLQEELGRFSGKRLFLWISPKGSAGNKGIYKKINYGYHQIYIGTAEDRKTQAYALKSDIDERVLASWINQVSNGKTSIKGEDSLEFLFNPVVVPFFSSTYSSDEMIAFALVRLKNILAKSKQSAFYKDVEVENLPDSMIDTKIEQERDVERIARELDIQLSMDKWLGYEEARRAIGGQMYVLYESYANKKGEFELKGCSGGTKTTKNLFENEIDLLIENIFSTAFRIKNSTTDEEYKFDKIDDCVKCGAKNVAVGPCKICQPCDKALRAKSAAKYSFSLN
ncbi:MAG: hypothetical protein ABH816_01845 [Candidatus Levyibacteriota bacterium]